MERFLYILTDLLTNFVSIEDVVDIEAQRSIPSIILNYKNSTISNNDMYLS